MSKLEELLQEVKVEWKQLGDIADLFGGLKGKSKADFTDGNAKYVTYKNIYNNIEVDFDSLEMVKVLSDENQYEVKYGDILFTGSSENASEAGISSAVTTNADTKVFLNSFSFGLRFKSEVNLLPEFSKYLFRSKSIRDEIIKTASGVTRYNVSKKRFVKILIPIPPIEIQQEIVRILDKLTETTNNLKTELENERQIRKKQFEFYREQLFTFKEEDAEINKLEDIALKISSGGTPNTKISEYWENGTIPWMSSGEVNYGTIYKTEKFITEFGLKNSSAKYVPKNSIVIALAGQGKTRGMVARTKIDLTTNQSLGTLTLNENIVTTDYVYHYLKTQYENLRNISSGNENRGGLNLKMISNYPIPIPSLEEQERIVNLLDQFDAAHTAIEEEITKEIKLRTQQYAYYREKLLTFPKK